jgi:prevent-host-death family protein
VTTNTWPISEAKNKFSEVVRRAQSECPQYITVRGRRAVVVLSIKDYEEWKAKSPDRGAASSPAN